MRTYMAAGRHSDYYENEFEECEGEFEFSKRELGYAKGIRNGEREYERSQSRDRGSRDKGRLRQKDINERVKINVSGYQSGPSRSNSRESASSGEGTRLGDNPLRAIDREPGELSSDSGSDEAIDSESWVMDNGGLKLENGAKPSMLKNKRKFSPIVWDRDYKEVSNVSKSRFSPANNGLPPPPPLPKSYRQSPYSVPTGCIKTSPSDNSKIPSAEPSPANLLMDVGSHDSSSSEPLAVLSPSPFQEERVGYNQNVEQHEDADSVPARNIRASRWANNANSPADEGELSDSPDDDGMQNIRKQKTPKGLSEPRSRRRSLSPQAVELKREGSEGVRARSTESDDGAYHVWSSGRDNNPDNELDRSDYMDIDERSDSAGVSQSDADSENDRDSPGTPEHAGPQRSVNMLQGCRSVEDFERLNKIDEGTYGVVYRAKDKKTGEVVALKKVKMEKEREGFPLTALREINILLSFHHPSIVDVKEVVVGNSLDSIFMVMEYMEHDLKALMETMKQPFSQSEVKCLMLQLLEGTKYLHENWVLHRDLKTSNLLLNNRGELKICDFGLARQYGSPLKPYTHLVVTLWYRAPELLLGAKQYSTAIDMWSLGCIMAELLSKQPLFNGKTEVDQLDKIFKTLGTPNETIWPGFSKLPGVKVNFVKHQYNLLRRKFPATSFTGSPVLSDAGFDLLNKLLTYDPDKRISVEAALNHQWFREVPLPKSKDFMPTFPAQHAQDRRTRRVMKSPDPLEEQRRKELQQEGLGTGGLFGFDK